MFPTLHLPVLETVFEPCLGTRESNEMQILATRREIVVQNPFKINPDLRNRRSAIDTSVYRRPGR